jgi:serine protease Do
MRMTRVALSLALFLVASVSGLLGLLAGGGGVVRTSLPRPVAGGPPSFADIVQRVNPAVVHIAVIEGGRTNPHEGIEAAPDLDVPQRGEGSGFIVDPQGYILTNHHLVPTPGRIRVRLADKREFPAVLVGADASTDLALVKVTAQGLPTVPLGDSDRLRVGEWVCAIGNPLHFDHTVTVGVVSSKGRKIFDLSFDAYIQTDAAINPGNSGGPLINGYGEAVGINSAVSSEGQGIGFAVPINVAKGILDQLRTHGRVSRGYLGIQLQELDPDLQGLIGLREAKGAVVLDVVKGGAGETAGLRRYDVITAVSGRKIEDDDELVRTISSLSPGSAVRLSVFRDGRDIAIEARLEERSEGEPPAASPQAQPTDTTPVGDPLGLVVQDLSPRTKRSLRIPPERAGVVVKDVVGLDPGTDVLDHGDIIVEVNRRPTPDAKTYRRVLGGLRPGDKAWLYVYRPRPAGTFLTKIEVEGRR